MQIVGAGLAGLIAAQVFPKAEVFEANSKDTITHKAVLRFRTNKVAEAVGVDFRKVMVHKGVWSGEKFVDPSIQLANLYSKKVIGKYADRSIWNLAPAERYVAPADLIQILAEQAGNRIHWNTPFEFAGNKNDPVISTAPMFFLANKFSELHDGSPPAFGFKEIYTARFTIPNCDVFQTVYFPDPDDSVYRASITGNLLIIESVSPNINIMSVLNAFGLILNDLEQLDCGKQSFGKIAAIDDVWRKRFILKLSTEKNIYSVGRFATWRNILLDDVVHDLAVVKRLIFSGVYNHHLKGV